MADDKKFDKKAPPPVSKWDPVEIAFILLIAMAILGFLASNVSSIFSGASKISFFGIPLSSFGSFFISTIPALKFISFIFCGFAFIATIIFSQKKNKIWAEQRAELKSQVPVSPAVSPTSSLPSATVVQDNTRDKDRWQEIQRLVNSELASNWRVAIIEADIILDELLDKLGLPGDSVGEKLKAVERSDFNTIDFAWEAHKVRNAIAHDGSFALNQREARLTIGLFEAVFKEFYMI